MKFLKKEKQYIMNPKMQKNNVIYISKDQSKLLVYSKKHYSKLNIYLNTSFSKFKFDQFLFLQQIKMEPNKHSQIEKYSVQNSRVDEGFLSGDFSALEIKQGAIFKDFYDFVDLINSQSKFIDKSLFIKSLQCFSFLVITRPKRWGKSYFCSMIKYFYKMEVNQAGEQLETQPYLNYFRGGPINGNKISLPLNIWNSQKKYCQKHQAKYPLIYLALKKNKTSSEINYYNLKLNFIRILYDHLTQNFKYLEKSANLKKYFGLIQKMKRFRDQNQSQIEVKQIKEFNLSQCLDIICQAIYKFHKKKCIIIVDQFDSYIVKMINQKKNKSLCIELAEQFTLMYQNVSKHSTNTQFILLVGVFNILKKENQSSLNNVTLDGIIDQNSSCGFGFTKEEIEKQLISQIFQNQYEPLLFKRINQWYNGYNVYNGMNKIKIHNPWSVAQYIATCKTKTTIMNGFPYWIQASNNLILREILSLAKGKNLLIKMLQLVKCMKWQEQFANFESENNFIVLKYSMKANIIDLYKDLEKIKEDNNKLQEYVSFMLLNMGYLTADQINPQDQQIKCYIPNKQIAIFIKRQFSEWLSENNFFDLSLVNVLKYQQFNLKMMQTYEHLKDCYVFGNQFAFSAIFGARVSMSHKNNKIKSFLTAIQINAGNGRADTAYYPVNNLVPQDKKCLVIHQYKYTQDLETDKKIPIQTIEEGIHQILLKNYLQFGIKLHDQYQERVKTIILRGILIVQDIQKRQIKLINNQISLNIQEAKYVSKYFQDQKNYLEDQGKKLSTTNKFKKILQKQEVSDYKELIKKIIQFGNLRKRPLSEGAEKVPIKKRNT